MNVITVCSHKGGVGKTTVALNLSLSFARRGYRTLLIDVDPQGAIGMSLGKARTKMSGLAEVLADRASARDALVRTRIDGLALLPIGRLRMRQSAVFDRHLEDGAQLKQIIAELADEFDIVIIDTPAGFGGATIGALRASTHMLSPLATDPLAMRGAPELLELAVWLQEEGYPIEFLGFVATMVDYDNPASVSVLHEARERFGAQWMLESVIRRDDSFLEASAAGVPLSFLRRTPPPAAAAFDQLALEIETRLQTTHQEEEGYEPISLLD
jgi:chromosome partitioning protein